MEQWIEEKKYQYHYGLVTDEYTRGYNDSQKDKKIEEQQLYDYRVDQMESRREISRMRKKIRVL